MKKDIKVNTTTVTTHTLNLKGEDMKDNMIKSFLSVIEDYVREDDLQSLKMITATFNVCLNYIVDKKWSRLFNEGYTAMLLSAEEFAFIDHFFLSKKKEQHNEKLELKIESLLDEQPFFVCEENIHY